METIGRFLVDIMTIGILVAGMCVLITGMIALLTMCTVFIDDTFDTRIGEIFKSLISKLIPNFLKEK